MNKTKKELIDYLWNKFINHPSCKHTDGFIEEYNKLCELSNDNYPKLGRFTDEDEVEELLKHVPSIPRIIRYVYQRGEGMWFSMDYELNTWYVYEEIEIYEFIHRYFEEGLYLDYLKLVLAEGIKDEDQKRIN